MTMAECMCSALDSIFLHVCLNAQFVSSSPFLLFFLYYFGSFLPSLLLRIPLVTRLRKKKKNHSPRNDGF